MKKLTTDYFIKKFEAIPEELWTRYTVGLDPTSKQKCALGHCGVKFPYVGNENESCAEGRALSKLFDENIYEGGSYFNYFSWTVVDISDGNNPTYPQPTPKQRILAALYDIKEKNQ